MVLKVTKNVNGRLSKFNYKNNEGKVIASLKSGFDLDKGISESELTFVRNKRKILNSHVQIKMFPKSSFSRVITSVKLKGSGINFGYTIDTTKLKKIDDEYCPLLTVKNHNKSYKGHLLFEREEIKGIKENIFELFNEDNVEVLKPFSKELPRITHKFYDDYKKTISLILRNRETQFVNIPGLIHFIQTFFMAGIAAAMVADFLIADLTGFETEFAIIIPALDAGDLGLKTVEKIMKTQI